MKYIKVKFPDVKKYLNSDWFNTESYFDPLAQVWFIPENRYESTIERSDVIKD